MDRLLVLTRLIERLGPIKGEKCLQKLVYLLQSRSNPFGYSFNWKSYGPVSETIQRDIKEGNELGLFQIQIDDGIPIYAVGDRESVVSDYWQQRYSAFCLPKQLETNITELQEQLGQDIKDPLKLEIIASLDYLTKQNDRDPVSSLVQSSHGRINPQLVQDIAHQLNVM